jgi:hypothetical protein
MKRMNKAAIENAPPAATSGPESRVPDAAAIPADRLAVPAVVRRGPVPTEIKTLAQQMLAEGASPEEIVAAARSRGWERITQATVKRWLGRDPVLRERARQRQLEAVNLLEKRLAGSREPAKARLAEVARLAGLTLGPGVRSRLDLPKMVELQASMWDELQRENIALKQRALTLEAQKESISRRIEAVRTVVDRMRWQAVQKQLDQLWEAVNRPGEPEKLARPLADTLRSLYRAAGGRRPSGFGNRE